MKQRMLKVQQSQLEECYEVPFQSTAKKESSVNSNLTIVSKLRILVSLDVKENH